MTYSSDRIFPRANTTPLWVYSIAVMPSTLLVVLAAVQPWVVPSILFRDALRVAEEAGDKCCHNYFGLFSNLGILLWSGAASICLFSALFLLRKSGVTKGSVFLVFGASLTWILAVDDFFMIHEGLQANVSSASEKIIFALYGIFTLLYLISFRNLIVTLDVYVLCMSLSLFGVSMIVDIGLAHDKSAIRIIIEDGAKFVAISAWATFQIRASWILIRALSDRDSLEGLPRLGEA